MNVILSLVADKYSDGNHFLILNHAIRGRRTMQFIMSNPIPTVMGNVLLVDSS